MCTWGGNECEYAFIIRGDATFAMEAIPPTTYEPQKWVDFFRDGELPWTSTYDLTLDEFPGVMFNWTSGKVTATEHNGIKDLFTGMPVWNVYLADLSSDGLPELCATVSFGSGIVDTRVIIYDYANDRLYDLSDRGYYDCFLSIKDSQLVVTQAGFSNNSDNDIQAIGSMAIIDGELVTFGIDRTLPESSPQETTLPDDKYELIQRVENSLSIIMSSPLTSSSPQDYINAHQEEYENLTAKYSDGVLEYLLSEFETGNSDGLRGHIMMRVCKDILGLRNNVSDESLLPQEWYSQLSIISETWLPDFKPEKPEGRYGELVYSAITQFYSRSDDGFLVTAPTVYGSYEEEGKLKIFMTVYYERYKLHGKTLESTGGAVIPGAAIFRKNEHNGEWIFEEYLEVGSANLPDGMYLDDSIKKLCVMPVSGQEIAGLAKKMNDDYVNDIRRELLSKNLIKHLLAHGQIGVSLQKPDGSTVKLT